MAPRIILLIFLFNTQLSFPQQSDGIEKDIKQIELFLFSYNTNKALDKIDCLLLSEKLHPDAIVRIKVLKIEALVKSGLYDSGLKLADEILEIQSLKIENKVQTLLMRSLLYEHTEDFTKSFNDLREVAEIYSKENLEKDQDYGVYLFRLASWYRLNKQPALANEFANKANMFGRNHDYKQVISTSYLLLGLIHDDYIKKKGYFEDAIKVYKKYDDFHGIAAIYNSLANLEIQKGQIDLAISYSDSLHKMVTLNNQENFSSSALYLKSKTLELKSKINSSFIYFKKFHEAKLTDINKERNLYVKELQFQLDLEEKKLQNEILYRQLEAERDRKNNLIMTGAGLLVLMGVTFGYTLVLFRKNRKINLQTSEIRVANKALESSVAEKEVLLKEIFHRVKNNLALIHSLIEFQIGDAGHELVKERFESLESRVKAISIAHEQFMPPTQNNKTNKYNLQEYLKTIVASYRRTDGRKVSFQLTIDPIKLNLDKAMPIGILINELISNSVKHAKTKNNQLEIYLRLTTTENRIHIEYRDSGVVFKEDRVGSLGLFIIESMVQQLKGEITRHASNYKMTLNV